MTLNLKNKTSVSPLMNQAIANVRARFAPIEDMPNDVCGWMETYFRLPPDEVPDQKLILFPYQRYTLTEAFSRDARGLYKYSTIVWSDLKKSLKSCIAAGVMLWKAWHSSYATLYVVANDLKQADSRVAYYIRRAIQLHPELREKCKIKPSGYSIELPNHTTIEALSIDPEGEAGSNPDFVEWTEAWGLMNNAHIRMFNEMALPPAKLGKAMRYLDTYSGFKGESIILEQMYDTGVTQGRRIHDDYELYVNDSARMLTLWNTKIRLPWHTPEHLASEAKILTPENFERFYHNAWASATDQFVPIQWWDSCQGEVPPIQKGEFFVAALDAAVSQDSTALVVISCRHNDPLLYVRHVAVWYPPQGGKIDLGEVEREVRRAFKQFHWLELTFDPMHIEYLVANLLKDGIYCHSMNQGAERLKSDIALYEAIRDRLIRHSGEPELRQHIMNSSRKVNANEGLRIVKAVESKRIDATVALSMAAWTMKFVYHTV